MFSRFIEFIATGFYFGKAPKAPGTFGTLWGIPLVYLLAQTSQFSYMLAAILLIVISSVSAELHERFTKTHDPKEIVIDEIAGFVIAMTWLPQTWQAYLAAFVLFRFFDILKPFPISYMDRNIKGGLGTTLDDVAAGLAANVILQIAYTHTAWLGEQLRG
jgi:phosphatidylglycerophosphatase A